MERMTMIAVGGMLGLALLSARLVPVGAPPMGPASAAGWQVGPVQVSENARLVEAG